LLDVNNAYVSAMNHGLDASAYIDAMPKEPVGELHLAGHHVAREDGVTILIDDHGSPVADPVWTLYEQAAGRFPTAPTLVEWDNNIPSLETLVDQARRADAHRAGVLGKGGHDIAA
jgi:uncharacterized protein (UPF0276 family)